jgi:prepilin peptidase CpaA
MLGQPYLFGAGQILLGILAAVAAIFDIRFRRIPNWLVLAGIIAGVTWNISSSSSGWSGLGRAAAGLGLGFILYFPLYLLRARGAGDVKLLAAAGAIAGPQNCIWIFLLTAVLGGLIALVVLLFHGRLHKTLFNVAWIMRDLMHFRAPYRSSEELDVTTTKGLRLPHAAMIAVGVAAFIFIAQFGLKV